jgi:diamine N-acetyltransferase
VLFSSSSISSVTSEFSLFIFEQETIFFLFLFCDMLLIRNAGVEDIPLIRDLAAEIWPVAYTAIIGATQVAYMLDLFYSADALKKQMEHGHSFIVCNDEAGKAVGFASWALTEPGIYKLHKLYVLPTRQGAGIGKAMVDHIVAQLQGSHATLLYLNVNRYNMQAKTFYEKAGFHHLKDEDIDIGNGYFMNDHVLGLEIGK